MGYSPWRHNKSDMSEATEHAHTRPRDAQVRPILLANRGGKGTGSDSPSQSPHRDRQDGSVQLHRLE